MRLWRHECFSLLSRRPFRVLFITLLLLNFILLYTQNTDAFIPNQGFRRLYEELLQQRDEAGREGFLRAKNEQLNERLLISLNEGKGGQTLRTNGADYPYTGFLLGERALFKRVLDDFVEARDYPSYLQNRLDELRAEPLAIFRKNDAYAEWERARSLQDLAALQGIKPYLVNSNSFYAATDYPLSDVLVGLILFAAILHWLIAEKEKGLDCLFKPSYKGRSSLVWGKLGSLIALVLLTTLLFHSGNLAVALLKFGRLDYAAPLQSVSGWRASGLNFTIGQYLLFFLLGKFLAYLHWACLSFCAAVYFRQLLWVYLVPLAQFLFSIGLKTPLFSSPAASWLSELNSLRLLDINGLGLYYRQLPLGGRPVNRMTAFGLVAGGTSLFFACLGVYIFNRQENLPYKKISWPRFVKRRPFAAKLWRHEAYKLFIVHKALLLLLCLLALQIYRYSELRVYADPDEHYYSRYLSQLEGELNEEKLTMIQAEEQKLYALRTALVSLTEDLAAQRITQQQFEQESRVLVDGLLPERAFTHLQERVAYALARGGEGQRAELIDERGYLRLFGLGPEAYTEDFKSGIYLFLCLLLAIAPFYANEWGSGAIQLISPSLHGRERLHRCKQACAFIYVSLAFILAQLPYALFLTRHYSFAQWTAALRSLEEFSAFFLELPLKSYLIVLYLLKYLAALCLTVLLIWFSVRAKESLWASVVACAVFVLPQTAELMGLQALRYLSFNAFVSVNACLNVAGGRAALLAFPILLLLTFYSARRVRQAFMRN